MANNLYIWSLTKLYKSPLPEGQMIDELIMSNACCHDIVYIHTEYIAKLAV
jgi:hypothetical protein